MVSAWKADRDTLVEETMAFVAKVNQDLSSLNLTKSANPTADGDRPNVEARQPRRTETFIDSERAAIMERVANFKAHQGRLIREREAFATTTLDQIRSSGKL